MQPLTKTERQEQTGEGRTEGRELENKINKVTVPGGAVKGHGGPKSVSQVMIQLLNYSLVLFCWVFCLFKSKIWKR